MTSPVVTVVCLLPDLLDLHADSANAAALRKRAGWEGITVELDAVNSGEKMPDAHPDLVLVGSGADDDLESAASELGRIATCIRDWLDAGSALLAIGTGWELLAGRVEYTQGESVAGLGIFTGSARLLPKRASGDLVVSRTGGFGAGAGTDVAANVAPDVAADAARTAATVVAVGFENHYRGYAPGAGELPLGAVSHGVGNGDGREGVRRGAAIGTHLHGPLLAKNPALADELIADFMRKRHRDYRARSREAAQADYLADLARRDILSPLGIS